MIRSKDFATSRWRCWAFRNGCNLCHAASFGPARAASTTSCSRDSISRGERILLRKSDIGSFSKEIIRRSADGRGDLPTSKLCLVCIVNRFKAAMSPPGTSLPIRNVRFQGRSCTGLGGQADVTSTFMTQGRHSVWLSNRVFLTPRSCYVGIRCEQYWTLAAQGTTEIHAVRESQDLPVRL